MENYNPQHNDYEALREASEQQSARQNEQQAQERAQQLQEQEAQQKEQEREAQEEKAQEQKEQEQKAQEELKAEEQKEQEHKAQEQKAQEQKEQEQKVQEPVRPEQHYGERYAQGSGDYVSETTAALKNDQMINNDYYASMQANEAGDRDMARDAVEHDVTKEQTAGAQEEGTVTRDEEVSKLADEYAAAHPDSGMTDDEIYEAAYFAKSVEDSEKYPPVNEEMKNQVEDRQASEEIGNNLREVSDEGMELSSEEEQELMQERMETHLSHQHSASMA